MINTFIQSGKVRDFYDFVKGGVISALWKRVSVIVFWDKSAHMALIILEEIYDISAKGHPKRLNSATFGIKIS